MVATKELILGILWAEAKAAPIYPATQQRISK